MFFHRYASEYFYHFYTVSKELKCFYDGTSVLQSKDKEMVLSYISTSQRRNYEFQEKLQCMQYHSLLLNIDALQKLASNIRMYFCEHYRNSCSCHTSKNYFGCLLLLCKHFIVHTYPRLLFQGDRHWMMLYMHAVNIKVVTKNITLFLVYKFLNA